MWLLMFACNIMLPITMIILGYMMYKRTPKAINLVYGYRTKRSMKNMDTWNFAHNYFGRLWIKIGCPLLVPSVIIQFLFKNSSDDAIVTMSIILMAVQLCVASVPIIWVEKALKDNFDEYGNKKIHK